MRSNYKSYSDAQLTELLILEDDCAFEEIYNRYWGILYNFARRTLRDDDQAKDVIQEVFVKLYERMGGLYNQSIRSYLYTSVLHNILDLYDHQKVRINYIAAFRDFYNRGENVTENQVRENELKRLIEKEIANLPAKMRTIFEMSRKQYLTHQQIADRIGVSEGTVRNQVYNALNKLRSRLSCMFFLQLMSTILWFNRL